MAPSWNAVHNNARPTTLRGWTALWREAAEAGARVIILDPALAAYVGEPNAPAPVREFLAAITREAEQIGAGGVSAGAQHQGRP